jgi:hypothetical protein
MFCWELFVSGSISVLFCFLYGHMDYLRVSGFQQLFLRLVSQSV